MATDDLPDRMSRRGAGLLQPVTLLRGKYVAITGKLSRPRAVILDLIAAAGGVTESAISRHTQYLVTGDTGVHGFTRKMREAQARGVQIINEAGLRKLAGDEVASRRSRPPPDGERDVVQRAADAAPLDLVALDAAMAEFDKLDALASRQ